MAEILHPPKALVLTVAGINRDTATQTAYKAAGASADIVHINEIKNGEVKVDDYQILSIPGGFSYGDHIQSGRILALELQKNNLLADYICKHLEKGRLILGVCNGFQVLVQCGLLPFGKIQPLDKNVATLTNNEPPRFQSRWIYLKSVRSRCLFVDEGETVTFPIAHGEGRFLTKDDVTLQRLINEEQIVYQYQGENPNGSQNGIAAICDPSGQILGMMPHAEDFVRRQNYPNWRSMDEDMRIDGLDFFKKIVKVAKGL
jgi:phosphoribosylformylglycinamidine synthase subunit PurQ / glutaminase